MTSFSHLSSGRSDGHHEEEPSEESDIDDFLSSHGFEFINASTSDADTLERNLRATELLPEGVPAGLDNRLTSN
jgi:hypothetical protein